MADQYGIALLSVELAVGLVSHPDIRDPVPMLQHHFSWNQETLSLHLAHGFSSHLSYRLCQGLIQVGNYVCKILDPNG